MTTRRKEGEKQIKTPYYYYLLLLFLVEKGELLTIGWFFLSLLGLWVWYKELGIHGDVEWACLEWNAIVKQ